MELIRQYFSELNDGQLAKIAQLEDVYTGWNARVNLISRKDMGHFVERHVLHSLAIAKYLVPDVTSAVLDVGTGGGFPGVPLAIVFPEVQFTLVDSIGKKIKVVNEVARQLNLENVTAIQTRVEDLQGSFDYIVSRAVTNMPQFVDWTRHLLKTKANKNSGIWYLKGGDLTEELTEYPFAEIFKLAELFPLEFYQTKKIVHLPGDKL